MTETAFVPGPETQRKLRDALGCFGTGVTVVTTMTPEGPLAMTANSFASVSLDPALVLWSPAKSSSRHAPFVEADRFVIQIMEEGQQAIATRFARDGRAFDGADWSETDHGQPMLGGCLAYFQCARYAVHDAGDHSIVLGAIERAAFCKGRGLIFKRGQYGGFAGLE